MRLRRRRVECGDLVQHQPLVGERLRDDHRGPQRGDGRRRGAVDALDQLDVVLPDQVDRQIGLDRDRHLGEQVLVLLADVEEHVLTERFCSLGVGRLDLGDLGSEGGVEVLGEVDVLPEPLHRLPEVGLLLFERGVVLAELVLPLVQRVEDRVEVRLRALVPVEVVPQLVAEGDHPEELLDPGCFLGVEVLDGVAQLQQRVRDLGTLVEPTFRHRLHRPLQHAVADLGRGADVGVAHRADALGLGRELGGLGVEADEAVDVLARHLVEPGQRRCVQRHHARRGGGLDGRHRLRWFEDERRRRRGRRQLLGRRGGRRRVTGCLGGGRRAGRSGRHLGHRDLLMVSSCWGFRPAARAARRRGG